MLEESTLLISSKHNIDQLWKQYPDSDPHAIPQIQNYFQIQNTSGTTELRKGLSELLTALISRDLRGDIDNGKHHWFCSLFTNWQHAVEWVQARI